MEALKVAKYIINKCTKEKKNPICCLQIMNLLYHIQIEHTKQFKELCFTDDILAYRFGPCITTVFRHYYSSFASFPIEICYKQEELPIFDYAKKRLIDSIIENKRNDYIWDIVNNKDSLWYKTFYEEKHIINI